MGHSKVGALFASYCSSAGIGTADADELFSTGTRLVNAGQIPMVDYLEARAADLQQSVAESLRLLADVPGEAHTFAAVAKRAARDLEDCERALARRKAAAAGGKTNRHTTTPKSLHAGSASASFPSARGNDMSYSTTDAATASILDAAARDAGQLSGQPNIKRASARYDACAARKSYPNDARWRAHAPLLAGRDMVFEDRPVYDLSQQQRAYGGAYFAFRSFAASGATNPMTHLTDHHRDLMMELLEKGTFVGQIRNPNAPDGIEYWSEPKQLNELQRKTYLEDSTSGGTNLVPYFFDVDIVTYPLLYNQLFPFVDLRDLDWSNQVKTPTLANLTISSGPAEGDSPGITLQTTTSLSTVLTSNVYNATGAITVGRDMLADTPIALMDWFLKLYVPALGVWIDNAITSGDGTTTPLGIFNTSSTKTYSTPSGSGTAITPTDIEGMIFSQPVQYRQSKAFRNIFLATDEIYREIRGIHVGTSDARRIFGYDYDAYQLAGLPFKINESGPTNSIAQGRIDLYRMWRRKGLDLQQSVEGKTLMLANEALLTARSRWAGQVVDANSWVICNNIQSSKN